MKKSTIKVLGVLAVLAVGGSVIASSLGGGKADASALGDPAIPALQERLNDVAEVQIRASGEVATIKRGEGNEWTLAEKDGYPVLADKVSDLLLNLRKAEVVEEKTSKKEKFDRLGLVEPSEEATTSRRVTLRAADGDVVADVLIGDRQASKGGFGGPGLSGQQFFLHPGGDARAVLANGDLYVDSRVIGWVDQAFLNLGRDRIKALRVTHAGAGEPVVLVREDMDASDVAVRDVPEGKQKKAAGPANQILSALSGLRFDDVQRVDAVDWTHESLATAEFFTEHGLRIRVETVELADEDGGDGATRVWGRFSFDVARDAMPEGTAPADEPDEVAPAEETPEGEEPAEVEEEDDPAPTLADLEREARDLAEKTNGWAIVVPSWKSKSFRLAMDELVEDVPEAEPVEATPLVAPPTPPGDAPEEGSGESSDGGAASTSETGGGI